MAASPISGWSVCFRIRYIGRHEHDLSDKSCLVASIGEQHIMSDNDDIRELVGTLKKFKPGAPLKHFITHATFPKFKSIEPGARVDFSFPLTALVGANGIGKSSFLDALWGMPWGSSTSRFWFATDLDPIEGNRKDPQRFFYGHWSDSFKGVVETRKARIGKKRGADYWEPYRTSTKDGMLPLSPDEYEGKSKDRWNPVKRPVVYINLKSTFGSFDRYFYFDEGLARGDKRSAMLRVAKRLKTIKDKGLQSYVLGNRERVFENRELSKVELRSLSGILGREYDSARLIRHSLYPANRGQDISVVFRRGTEYSEAFAGSGEVAAVSAVVDILSAQDYSLILLDEPETSLHPGAQRALLKFLLEQIKFKKHQVVISTHSIEFLDDLPHDAIKVFESNGGTHTRVLPKSSPSAAFKRLGKTPPNTWRILVEDPLAELLVLQAMKGLDHGDADTIEVKVTAGGAEGILKYAGPNAMVSGDTAFYMLDGDKRKVDQFTDPDTIAPAEHVQLSGILRTQLGCDPLLPIPGGDDNAGHLIAKARAQLDYLAWLRKHVDFLPKQLPEHIVLEALEPGQGHEALTTIEAKEKLRRLLADGSDADLSSADFLGLAKVKISKISNENPDIQLIRASLLRWLPA